jgi:hypothetical protein
MSLVLQSSGGGQITIQEPATASNFTQDLPAGTGTIAVQGASTNIVSGASVPVSGTSIDFTGIPSWVRRVTVMLNAVSWSSTASVQIQLGDSGGVETSGYNSVTGSTSTSATVASFTSSTSFSLLNNWGSDSVFYGSIIFSLLNASTNTWAAQGIFSADTSTGDWAVFTSGAKSLSATLDRVRVTTVQSANFATGAINILYE